jgi:CubicO group peptidase (beta-lactamase class C family)
MRNCFGHDGSTGAMMWADRQHNVTIVVLSNSGHPLGITKKFEQLKPIIVDAIMTVLGY